MGVVSAGWMWRNFRYSILVIFIIAAIITPTTDIMNMCIFAAPMIVLYLFSIAIAWFVHPTQRKKRAAKAGLSLDKWLAAKERDRLAEEKAKTKAMAAMKPAKPPGFFKRLLERAHKPLKS